MKLPGGRDEKYDRYLSDQLSAELFVRDRLDLREHSREAPRDESLNGLTRLDISKASASCSGVCAAVRMSGLGLTQRQFATR